MYSLRTSVLEIFYEDSGPTKGSPVLMLHGWPDAPRGWTRIARELNDKGWRTIIPCLRGTRPTRFVSPDIPRVGAGVALAQDAIDLADALSLDRFTAVGHDWGARAAYLLAALFPERINTLIALALGYQPRGVFHVPDFEQSKRFWYQWFLCADGGAEKFRRDPVGFARIQWETWSPPGWFDDAEFALTSKWFGEPDWIDITLNAYRARWLRGEERDERYDELQRRLGEIDQLSTPTLMIQGASDYCDAPSESEDQEKYFTGRYRRMLLEGVGHFPHREAPGLVAPAIIKFLQANHA